MLNSSLSPYTGLDDSITWTKPSNAVRYITVILWASTIILGVVGNVLLSLTIGCSSSLRTAMNTYVLSIALVDFMTCALLLPMRLVIERETWMDREAPETLYGVELFIRAFTDVTRLFLMQSLSIERYQAIARPFSVSKIQARKRALAIIAVIWGVSVVVSGLSVRYFCDSVLDCRTNGFATEGWGDLEVFVELPLTFLSVIAIAISYGLIVVVLRQQRKKMNRHTKPKVKVNQVAPETEDKKLVSSSHSGAIATFLSSDGGKGCNPKSDLLSLSKGSNRKIVPCSTEKTDIMEAEKRDNSSTIGKFGEEKGIEKVINSCTVSPSASVAENKSEKEQDNKIIIGRGQTSRINSRIVDDNMKDDSEIINFEHGCTYVKSYDKILEDVQLKSAQEIRDDINAGNGLECGANSTFAFTDISTNDSQAHPVSTPSVPCYQNLNVKFISLQNQNASADVTRSLEAANKTPGISSVGDIFSGSSTSMDKIRTDRDSPNKDAIPRSNDSCRHEGEKEAKGICDRDLFKKSLLRDRRKVKLRSSSYPLLVSYINDAFVCDENSQENFYSTYAKEATNSKPAATYQRPALLRSQTDKAFFYRSEPANSEETAPHFVLVNTAVKESRDPCGEENSPFKEIELTNVKENVDPDEGAKEMSSSDSNTNSPMTSIKVSRLDGDVTEFDRRISLDSEIQNDAIDKDAISLRFQQRIGQDEKQEETTPKKRKIYHDSDNSFTDQGVPEKSADPEQKQYPSMLDPAHCLQKTDIIEATVKEHESIPQVLSSNLQDEIAAKSHVTETTPISNERRGYTDSLQKQIAQVSSDGGAAQKKPLDAVQTLAVPGSSATHVEVVEMDGSVHMEVIKSEVTTAPIEGAVCLMNPRNKEQGRRRVEFKAALKVGLLFCCFVCLWMPLPVFVFVMRVCVEWGESIHVDLLSIFSALATSTAAVDPIIYGLLNRQIRSAMQLGVRKIKRKLTGYCTNVA